jgi:hypothetical protein
MSNNLPAILTADPKTALVISDHESGFIDQAARLFAAGFYDHALLDVWNAAVANLRRRVEAYGVDIFLSVVKDEPGRKKFNADGETFAERWAGVDDLVLIAGSTALGLLNKKAGKSLEMINWMRNHATPAHDTDHAVEREDVIGLVIILQKNLFEVPLPDPGHSVAGLFEPVRKTQCTAESQQLLQDQIRGLRTVEVRTAFGFMLDLLCEGQEPAVSNVRALFPALWERASDDLKRTAGLRYHTFLADPSADTSADTGARSRLLDLLTSVGGVRFIPDAARATIYRQAARNLAVAKDSSYGWAREVAAARALEQFGPHVPSIAFVEVYQEILAVWCGNYWGRSDAYAHLAPFIDILNSSQLLGLIRLFIDNERVRAELFQSKPKAGATELLTQLRERLTIESHKAEVDRALTSIEEH